VLLVLAPRSSSSPGRSLRAAGLELAKGDLRQIGEALARIKVQGDRYPPHLAARTGR